MSRQSEIPRLNLLVGLLVAVAVVVAVVAVWQLDVTGRRGSGLGKEFVYDIDVTIDPNLILYEESAQPIDTGLRHASAVAIDSRGTIYVAGDKAVRLFGQAGNLLGEVELSTEPGCIAVTDDGRIYVGMRKHVELYDRDGQKLASWDSLGDGAFLTSIALWKDSVFVADAGNRVVVRYDPTGKVVNYIGRKDADRRIPGFVVPSPYFDLAVPKDGLLRVVSPGRRRIEAYTPDGDFEFWWGESSLAVEGFCGCCNPANIAVLPEGGFVTAEKGLVRVKVYDSEGRFVGVVAGPDQLTPGRVGKICEYPEECQAGGFDVAVDSAGRVFVLDTIKNIIRVYSRKQEG